MPKKNLTKPAEVLLYAASETNADMLYFGRVFVPDPFIAFSGKGGRFAVVNQLEYARVKKEGCFDKVLSLEEILQEAHRNDSNSISYPASVIDWLAKTYRIKAFRVSADFPCGPAFQLKEKGIRLDVVEGSLFPERECKSEAEAALIREGNAASSAGFRVVEKLLREAEVKKGYLYYSGRRLTAERVQEAIAVACLRRGTVASNTIVAGGDQACDPHCRGSGPLRANELIIVDIFPRITKTGYHGDMTRTYLKGRASEAQRALWTTVFEAQQEAISQVRSGKSAAVLHRWVADFFEKRGYFARRENDIPVGFMHGLGHGLGLAVHEAPRVSPAGGRLRNGQVITIEPGLYYPGLGGVRIEDVVRVQSNGAELLSKHGYRWEIR